MDSKPSDYFAQTRPEMLGYVPRSVPRVLEVGCANGNFGAQLKRDHGAGEVWGVEMDPAAAQVALSTLDRVLVGDIGSLSDELPAGHFECIVMNDVIEHLADPEAVVARLKRVLARDGVIVCSIPNIRYLYTLFDLVVRKKWEYEDAGVLDRTHLRFFTMSSIRNFFEKLGFEVERLEGIHGLQSWKFTGLNALFLGQLSDTRFPQFACVARLRDANRK